MTPQCKGAGQGGSFMSTPACKLVSGLWVGPYISGTHHYINGSSRKLPSFPTWDLGEGPLWITKGRRQVSVVLQDLRVLWKVSLPGSWHGGSPQISLAWSNLGSLAIQYFYSFTGKYEPMAILPLAMTKKMQDLCCL